MLGSGRGGPQGAVGQYREPAVHHLAQQLEVVGGAALATQPGYLRRREARRPTVHGQRIAQEGRDVLRLGRPLRWHLHQQLGRLVNLRRLVRGDAGVLAAVPRRHVLEDQEAVEVVALLLDLRRITIRWSCSPSLARDTLSLAFLPSTLVEALLLYCKNM